MKTQAWKQHNTLGPIHGPETLSELLFVLITFSALANGYRSENWENEELCGNTTPGQGSTSGEYVSPEHTISSFPNLYDC